jgi:predicted naringenin-chalcone synthase
MSNILAIGTALPDYRAKQDDILHFMQTAYNNKEAERKLKMLFTHSGIDYRYSVLPDFDLNKTPILFQHNTLQANITERMALYVKHALPLAVKAINTTIEETEGNIEIKEISHLITVSCTGMYAPGLDAELIEHYNLSRTIFRTAINFLGCNAAFHALKMADLIVKDNANAKVLIVCVELCTLHFQPKNNHDNLLSNTIFGDGAAAMIIGHPKHKSNSIAIKGFYSEMLKSGKSLMAWNINATNFEMILSSAIPDFIGKEVNNVLANAQQILNFSEVNNWAIHPGGKKVIDVCSNKLNQEKDIFWASYQVLNEFGNMSSPTILFVLKKLWQNNYQSRENIFALGFGPGLSIESALLQFE